MTGRLTVVMLICILCVPGKMYSQRIELVDQASQKPITDASVQINRTSYLSDESGIINHNQKGYQTITITHTNYYYRRSYNLDRTGRIYLTPLTRQLDDVIIAGRSEPQSVDQSVFVVKTINAQTIEQQGATDLSDALRNTLNITITPNKSQGSSSVNMLGLDGAYVKILIDGVPMVNANGNGNNADISQIDLSRIERIEIVEGPMAVTYGANASAGVINLITRQQIFGKINAQASIQEETVGSEYGKDKGRHIQNISLQYRPTDQLSLSAKFKHMRFNGFRNQYKGFNHPINDELRGFDWHPKRQYGASIGASYRVRNMLVKYRTDYFSQILDSPGKSVNENEHHATGIKNPLARDMRYSDQRIVHNLNLSGKIADRVSYDIASAYSSLHRKEQKLTSYIYLNQETINETIPSHYKVAMSRGSFTNFTQGKPLDFQVGYDFSHESIKAPNIRSGNIEGTSENVAKKITDIAFYASTKWSPVPSLTIRPGIRTFSNSQFESSLIYSINTRYVVENMFDVRLSFGRSYRIPNLTELFYYFVDANHDIRGNADLHPEDGYSLALDMKRTTTFSGLTLQSSFKLFHNDIKGKISIGIVNRNPLKYQYINIDRYQSRGVSFNNTLQYGKISGQAGISYVGYYKEINTDDRITPPDEFLYAPEYRINLEYHFDNPKITLATYFKHTGKKEQYVISGSNYRKGTTQEFDWMDISVMWQTPHHVSFQIGAKNIFNNTDLESTTDPSGAHTAAGTTTGLAYGRSYFGRISYAFSK